MERVLGDRAIFGTNHEKVVVCSYGKMAVGGDINNGGFVV